MIFTGGFKHEGAWLNTDFYRLKFSGWPVGLYYATGWMPLGSKHVFAVRTAAVLGCLAVALGAFGAHGLKALLKENGTADIWEKAVFYHLIHAVMLFVLAERKDFAVIAWWCFLLGIVFFSGSLYLLALTNLRWLGAITPVGGIGLLIGWAALAVIRRRA